MGNLKQRWGITNNFQFVIILIVFALTGSTSAYLAKPVLAWIGITRDTFSPLFYWPIYVVLIFPIYQVLLLSYGFIFGQFKFFWWFEKKMLKSLGLGFLFKNEKPSE